MDYLTHVSHTATLHCCSRPAITNQALPAWTPVLGPRCSESGAGRAPELHCPSQHKSYGRMDSTLTSPKLCRATFLYFYMRIRKRYCGGGLWLAHLQRGEWGSGSENSAGRWVRNTGGSDPDWLSPYHMQAEATRPNKDCSLQRSHGASYTTATDTYHRGKVYSSPSLN